MSEQRSRAGVGTPIVTYVSDAGVFTLAGADVGGCCNIASTRSGDRADQRTLATPPGRGLDRDGTTAGEPQRTG